MDKLKPCPFCGGKAKLINSNIMGSFVFCKDCEASGKAIKVSHEYASEQRAIEAWNKRTENEELMFARKFIHEQGLEFELAGAWNGRLKNGR